MWERTQSEDAAKKTITEENQSTQDQASDKWEKAANEESMVPDPEGKADMVKDQEKEGNKLESETSQKNSNSGQDRIACEICGLFSHATKDCRRMLCEICGFNNHITYDCHRCVPWNVGPELCAAQVEDQSFFFIEECIDPRLAKEKEIIGIISILEGKATARQIE